MTIEVNKIRSYQTLVYKNGRFTHRKPEYDEYIKEVSLQLIGMQEYKGDVELDMHFKSTNKMVGDLDNITKPILDILQMNRKIENDRNVMKLTLEKSFGNKTNQIEINIKKR